MNRAGCHLAIGFGCVASTLAGKHATAAEWSIAPTFSLTVDDDSNRRLAAQAQASQSAVFYTSWLFRHSTDNSQLTLSPWFSWQRFRNDLYDSDENGSLSGEFTWSTERLRIDTTAAVADQSTLLTEPTETGLISASTHNVSTHGTVSLTFSQTELLALVLQTGYDTSRYYGTQEALLPGYRNLSGSVGERLSWSEKTTFTASVFDNRLVSGITAYDSDETGEQLAVNRMLSETIQLSATFGLTNTSFGATRSTDTLEALSISRVTETGRVALDYSRGLTPYGNGLLTLRQQVTASGTRSLSERLSVDASYAWVQNQQSFVQIFSKSTTYDVVTLGVSWQTAETLALRAQLAFTEVHGLVSDISIDERRGSVGLIWTPHPTTRSF